MPTTRKIASGLLIFAASMMAHAAGATIDVPVAVSPGHAQDTALVGSACPTFNWGFRGTAERYELAIFTAGAGQDTSTPLLTQTLPGAAHGWTPDLGQCLQPGGHYAWSIRAVTATATTEWSTPRFFRVGPHSRAMQLEQAIAVINEVLAEPRQSGGGPRQPAIGAPPAPSARTKGAPGAQLQVAGGIVGASISGDGAGLTNVDATTLDGVDGSGYTTSNQSCPAGSYVQGIDATGSVVCASLADYVNQSCHLYFGWRDACDGCTTAPAKWGRVSAAACSNGAGVDNTCQTPTLGTEDVTLFGLNTDGDVDATDKFYVGLKCL